MNYSGVPRGTPFFFGREMKFSLFSIIYFFGKKPLFQEKSNKKSSFLSQIVFFIHRKFIFLEKNLFWKNNSARFTKIQKVIRQCLGNSCSPGNAGVVHVPVRVRLRLPNSAAHSFGFY